MFDKHASRRSFVRGALVTATALSLPAARAAAKASTPPKHIVLLGDSILANGAYVGDGPDVIEQLENAFPPAPAPALAPWMAR